MQETVRKAFQFYFCAVVDVYGVLYWRKCYDASSTFLQMQPISEQFVIDIIAAQKYRVRIRQLHAKTLHVQHAPSVYEKLALIVAI